MHPGAHVDAERADPAMIAMAPRTARAGPSNEAKKPSPAVSISIPR